MILYCMQMSMFVYNFGSGVNLCGRIVRSVKGLLHSLNFPGNSSRSTFFFKIAVV